MQIMGMGYGCIMCEEIYMSSYCGCLLLFICHEDSLVITLLLQPSSLTSMLEILFDLY